MHAAGKFVAAGKEAGAIMVVAAGNVVAARKMVAAGKEVAGITVVATIKVIAAGKEDFSGEGCCSQALPVIPGRRRVAPC